MAGARLGFTTDAFTATLFASYVSLIGTMGIAVAPLLLAPRDGEHRPD